jgi:hypothetical protein
MGLTSEAVRKRLLRILGRHETAGMMGESKKNGDMGWKIAGVVLLIAVIVILIWWAPFTDYCDVGNEVANC